jgi:hypothetical protein
LTEAILDKVTVQICHRVAGTEHHPTLDDAQAFICEVREQLNPVVERIVTKLAEDPDSLPKRAPTKSKAQVNGTAELMNVSLLGAPSQ